MSARLTLINGGGDVVSFLQDLTEQARRGEIDAIAVATVTSEAVLGGGFAFREDMASPFARILASVACLQHDLLDEGL